MNPIFIASVLVVAGFWVTVPFIPRTLAFDITNAMTVVLLTYAIWAFAPGIQDIKRGLSRANFLVLGIVSLCFAVISRTLWLAQWRYDREPIGGLDHIFVVFIAFMAVMGSIFLLLAPRVIGGRIPRSSFKYLVVAIVLGIIIGFAFWLTH